MNVGFFYAPQIEPPVSGGSIHGYHLAKGLSNAGHRVCTCYLGKPSTHVEYFRGRELKTFLDTIDVIYIRAEWAWIPNALSVLKFAARKRLPVVWELNGLPDEVIYSGKSRLSRFWVTTKLRMCAAAVDAVIAVSEEIQDFSSRELGVADSYCVPNGAAISEQLIGCQKPTKDNGTALQVAWIGTSSAGWHDLDVIVEAARLLSGDAVNVEISIIGNPAFLPERLPGNVRRYGSVPYAELASHLVGFDVGVHCFKRVENVRIAGSPLKLFDYMASGLAIVAEDCGQQGRIIKEEKAGLAFDGSAASLAECLRRLESDRQHCRQLGDNGRRAVDRFYNWDRVVHQTEEILLKTLNKL